MSWMVDVQAVQTVVTGLTSSLNSSEAYAAYETMISILAESLGEEAEALKELQKAEQSMIKELNNMLIQFANSVQFAADSFEALDSNTAKVMYK